MVRKNKKLLLDAKKYFLDESKKNPGECQKALLIEFQQELGLPRNLRRNFWMKLKKKTSKGIPERTSNETLYEEAPEGISKETPVEIVRL